VDTNRKKEPFLEIGQFLSFVVFLSTVRSVRESKNKCRSAIKNTKAQAKGMIMHAKHKEVPHELSEESSFSSLGLNSSLLEILEKEGFKTPSPIQKEVIPLILSGVDLIGQAQTGTGKTAAFGLPALHLLKNPGKVEVLVITPTRELASQVSEELFRFGKQNRTKIATIYGGKSFHQQIEAIKKGAQIVVATPGRLLDLLESKKLGAFQPSMVIVDEADEMLDMGFLEDIQAIFDYLPEERQTLLFSATMPPAIQSLAKKILKNPILVKAAQSQTSNQDISQTYCVIQDHERDHAIIRLFAGHELSKSIIFCKTKKEVDRLAQVLTLRGFLASGLHGDMEQGQREHVIHNFRTGKILILIATDVAARGLNIVDVSHVINYHLPFDAENYVHRIGRTGRAGRKGKAITLVTPKELNKLMYYRQTAGGTIEQGFIPSKQEIRKAQIARLIEEITNHTACNESYEMIQTLIETMDMGVITSKLLSLMLSQKPIEGPDHIGIKEGEKMKKNNSFSDPNRRKKFGNKFRKQTFFPKNNSFYGREKKAKRRHESSKTF
jgi:ATP-dependent RNA helicase DeaD